MRLDTPAGKAFDVLLLIFILSSVILVALESIYWIDDKHHELLNIAEWVITIIFSIEYILRIIAVSKPLKYILSPYGIIDFISTSPKIYFTFFCRHSVITCTESLEAIKRYLEY